MPYVLDESSYRIDKNVFPSRDEAIDRAGEASRILGRPVTVYELVAQELHFAFRVHPDGRVCDRNPLPEHVAIEPTAPAVLGAAGEWEVAYRIPGRGGFKTKRFKDEAARQRFVDKLIEKEGNDVEMRFRDPPVGAAVFDAVAQALEEAGRPDLAVRVDREAHAAVNSVDEGIRGIVNELMKTPTVTAAKKRKLTDKMAYALQRATQHGVVPGGSDVTFNLAYKMQDLGLLEGGQVLRATKKGEEALKTGSYPVG